MHREIRIARPNDFPVMERMLELYQYELSDIWDQDLDQNGQFGYDLSRHQLAERFFAYVMLVEHHYAGLALVAPAIVTQQEGQWMEQFFVMKKYRRGGNGKALAEHVIASHPGKWEIGELPANTAALAFWRSVIAGLTTGKFAEVQVTEGWWQGTVQSFEYKTAA